MNASTALSSFPPHTHTQLDGGEGALPVSSFAFCCCVLLRETQVKMQPLINTFVETGRNSTLRKTGNPRLRRKSHWNLFLSALNI